MSRTAQITGLLLLVVVIAMIALGWRLYDQSVRSDKPSSLGMELIYALDRRQTSRAIQLLDQGADVTAKEPYSGRTCLMAAASTGAGTDPQLIKRLIERGASVDATDMNGRTAFDYLFTSGQASFAIAKLLLPKPAAIRRKQSGVSTLETAIQTHDPAIVGLVLDSGANASETDMGAKPLLITAAEADDLPTVKLLVNHGASVNARGQMQETALGAAIHLADEPMAQFLIAHGAEVNALDVDRTPMLVAATAGNLPNTVSALLGKGAKVDTPNALGLTALIVATREGRRTIVQALLKRGADTKIKDKTSRTARDWAKDQGFADIERLLAAH
jgi:ankyrin repeat protein